MLKITQNNDLPKALTKLPDLTLDHMATTSGNRKRRKASKLNKGDTVKVTGNGFEYITQINDFIVDTNGTIKYIQVPIEDGSLRWLHVADKTLRVLKWLVRWAEPFIQWLTRFLEKPPQTEKGFRQTVRMAK